MATDTSKLAPRIIINERDLSQKLSKKRQQPITLIFGFSPIGKTCEMVECNETYDIYGEFGYPATAAEKYFIDAGLKVVENGATALMTRLPYDNAQSHTVKCIDYKVETPIALSDLATIPMETKIRKKDNNAVVVLKKMHGLDDRMNQVQRITMVEQPDGTHVKSITAEELVELELDPQENLEPNTFRIVDIRGAQYGQGAATAEYCGIFPIIVTSPMALYCQGKIDNTSELDKCMQLIDLGSGVEMSNGWYRTSDPMDENYKMVQAQIVASIKQTINFDSTTNKFHRNMSFQDDCVKRFPTINMVERNKIDNRSINEIGILVCKIGWDSDQQITTLQVLETFIGKLGRTRNSIDRQINSQSKYIRMYKNLQVPVQTDFFVADGQSITSLGMASDECVKYINYKTSIIDPVTYMLESVYSDIDSIQIDTILDAGLSTIAFQAYVAKNQDNETFETNPQVRTKINWTKSDFDMDEYVEKCAFVWNQVTKLFGNFISTVRGDCVYIADGPRMFNLMKNYPIRNYTDLENAEIFNKYLLFACSAVLLGVGLGVVLAWLPMQRAVLSSYEAHLNYGRGSNCFLPLQTALVVAGAFIVSLVAVYLGCTQLLRRTALALMQGATPASNSKKSSGSSSEKSLYFRLILRNMLSDRNRVLVTIISIAGGCVLMVVGFALRYGIMGVPDRQFGRIMTYDAEVYYDGKENADAAAEIETILNQNNLEHISVHRESGVFQAGDSLSSMTLVVAENGTLDGYFALKDIDSGNMLDVPDSGALVPRRFHEYYRIDVGGTVPAYDSGMNLCKLPVAGVFENYYGQLFFLSPQGYKESFKVAPEPNCFYVKTGGIPLSELQKKLEGVQGLTRVSDAAAERVMIGQFTSSLNFVVYLMLFIAGVMACFIVANFTMTYIQRKTGELTIMRINGFTSSECIRYLALDLVVTTVLGTALGLVLGGLMGARILRVTETPYIQMIREPRFESFLFAALITFAFSLLTNGFALRRIRKLKLTDINF